MYNYGFKVANIKPDDVAFVPFAQKKNALVNVFIVDEQ